MGKFAGGAAFFAILGGGGGGGGGVILSAEIICRIAAAMQHAQTHCSVACMS